MKSRISSFTVFLALTAVGVRAQSNNIFAQKVVEEIKAAHPEITGLEVAAIKPGKGCQTIAATEAKEIGQKCDKDELTARKTNQPFVEQEKTEFDVTLPSTIRLERLLPRPEWISSCKLGERKKQS